MFRGYNNSDATAGIEIYFDPAPTGIKCGDKIVEQTVGKVFMEGTLVPEGPEVKFQRLGFHDLLIGYIADHNFRKVRLSGFRTDAGEFTGV